MDIAAVRTLIADVSKSHKLKGQAEQDFRDNALDIFRRPLSAGAIIGYFDGKTKYVQLAEALKDFHVQFTNLEKHKPRGSAARATA